MSRRLVVALVIVALAGTAVERALAATATTSPPTVPTGFAGYCGMSEPGGAKGLAGFISELLGLKPEEVIAERHARRSFFQIAAEKGIRTARQGARAQEERPLPPGSQYFRG